MKTELKKIIIKGCLTNNYDLDIALDKAIDYINNIQAKKMVDFIKWIDEEEIPYEDGRWIQYFNEKDNYLTFEELYERYLLHTGALAGN